MGFPQRGKGQAVVLATSFCCSTNDGLCATPSLGVPISIYVQRFLLKEYNKGYSIKASVL